MSQLLTGDQIAKELSISRSLAYRLLRTGEITAIRIGRCLRCSQEDLEAFIQKNRSRNAAKLASLEENSHE